jgi:glycerol-3-phosphate cytidylyltransferase-like family protein
MSFDTRYKIIDIEQARRIASESSAPSIAFVTHLEVLRALHIRKLEEIAAANNGRLFVILTELESPLVPLTARAEVAAALRVVDYVIPAPDGAIPVLEALRPSVTIHDEEEDRERTRSLMEHVRSRARS